MSAVYYAVFNKESYPSDAKSGTAPITSCEIEAPGIKSAKFVKILSNAGTEAEALKIVRLAYPGLATDKIAIIPEANWTEG